MLLPLLNMFLNCLPHELRQGTCSKNYYCVYTTVGHQIMIFIVCCAMCNIKCATEKQLFPIFFFTLAYNRRFLQHFFECQDC